MNVRHVFPGWAPFSLAWLWLFAGCASTTTNPALQSWVGHSRRELLAAWGPPDRESSDGNGGKVLTYERVSGYITPGEVSGDNHSNRFIVSKFEGNQTTHHQVLYVNAAGRIYRWRRQS